MKSAKHDRAEGDLKHYKMWVEKPEEFYRCRKEYNIKTDHKDRMPNWHITRSVGPSSVRIVNFKIP
jgi:hypothetical protein